MTDEPTPPSPDVTGADVSPGASQSGLRRLHVKLHSNPVTGLATTIVITVVGTVVLIAGVIMMVTPGPGLLGIAAGLGILAFEWAWAARWVEAVRVKAREAAVLAKQMDPAVRRRRIVLGLVVGVVAVGLLAAYVHAYGWPHPIDRSWRWLATRLDLNVDLPSL